MKIYVVPCWTSFTEVDGVPDWHPKWYDWLQREYEAKQGAGTVKVLRMPNSEAPKISEWVGHLEKEIPSIDDDTVLIGHSIGCQAILRFLAKRKPPSVGRVILVAGWFELQGLASDADIKIAAPWETTPIDFAALDPYKLRTTVLLSDNDKYVELAPNEEKFKKHVTTDVHVLPGRGHFDEERDTQLAELVDLIHTNKE